MSTIQDHRLNKVEEAIDGFREDLSAMRDSVGEDMKGFGKEIADLRAEFRQGLAGYKAVWRFAAVMAGAMGAVAALIVSWVRQ